MPRVEGFHYYCPQVAGLTDCQKIVNTSAEESTMELLFGLAFSTHLGLSQDYNEIHPHIRLEQDGWIAGSFYNSESTISFYGGHRVEINEFGIEFGLTSGYDDFGAIIPFGRGTYSVNENTKLFIAPAPEKTNGITTLGAAIGTEFNF